MTKPDIRDFTRQELAGTLISLGKKGSLADRVFNCLYRKGAESFDAMAGVQEELKSTLAAAYTVSPAPSIEKRVSKIDNTIKLLFTFPDGAKAESVVLFNKKTVSACISSQSGCACGCAFCATGGLGLKRDLRPHEILAQFAACRKEAGRLPDSVLFMGMGEAIWEEVQFDSKGKILNPNLSDYRMPTAMDMPRVHSALVQSYEPAGPWGVKEVGEGATIPTMGCYANAIYDAMGVRVYSLPLSYEKVWRALKEKKAKEAKP